LVLGELNLIGTAAYCGEHAQVIELLQQGKIPAGCSSPAGSRWTASSPAASPS